MFPEVTFNYFIELVTLCNFVLMSFSSFDIKSKRNFSKHMTTDTKLRLHNITSKVSLCYGSENWIIN
jgi:hypothetical protein